MQTAMGKDDRMCINGKKKGRSNDEQQSWCDAVRCGASKGAEVLAELKIIDIESCTNSKRYYTGQKIYDGAAREQRKN